MCIKKARLLRGLEGGADPALVARIAQALGVSRQRLGRRDAAVGVYTVNPDGSLTWA